MAPFLACTYLTCPIFAMPPSFQQARLLHARRGLWGWHLPVTYQKDEDDQVESQSLSPILISRYIYLVWAHLFIVGASPFSLHDWAQSPGKLAKIVSDQTLRFVALLHVWFDTFACHISKAILMARGARFTPPFVSSYGNISIRD